MLRRDPLRQFQVVEGRELEVHRVPGHEGNTLTGVRKQPLSGGRASVAIRPEEIAIGDFVVSGGELPALMLIDPLPLPPASARTSPLMSSCAMGLSAVILVPLT